MPSKLRSVIVNSAGSTNRQAAAHAGSSANRLPTRFEYTSYLASTARHGAVKYSRKMKNSDQNTEVRACLTLGVV